MKRRARFQDFNTKRGDLQYSNTFALFLQVFVASMQSDYVTSNYEY